MRTTRLIAVLVGLAAVAVFATDASAYYHPGLGVWMSRDPGDGAAPGAPRVGTAGRAVAGGFIPRDQYADGMNLYQYVGSRPTVLRDALGLWGFEIHGLLTARLASMAGIACASLVGQGAQRPDDDERRPGWEGTKDLGAAQIRYGYWAGRTKASLMAEWHFPMGANGEVVANCSYARIKAATGIRRCDFTMFTEGLHVLQDSWSHQGRPYFDAYGSRIGHGRGVKQVGGVGSPWVRIDNTWDAAAGDHRDSADDSTLWPADVRAMGMATYFMLLEFKKACPCHCPSADPKILTTTSSGEPAGNREVEMMLQERFPGENKG